MTPYIVTGFYTPDYEPLARTFEANLDELNIPHRIYSHAFDGGWDRQLMAKPKIVLTALSDFPRATVVLMDIDCEVRKPIADVLNFSGDVALHIRCKQTRNKYKVYGSSRIIAFRQTSGARWLAASWLAMCKEAADNPSRRAPLCDEHLLTRAFATTPFVTLSMLPEAYAAFEHDEIGPEAAIVHHSARDKSLKGFTIKRALRSLRRRTVERITGQDYVERKYG